LARGLGIEKRGSMTKVLLTIGVLLVVLLV
jgi:hypothetical protein